MRRLYSIFGGIALGAAITFAVVFAGSPPAQARYAAIVIDAGTGKVLHAINADTRNYPASLTKMMTLYMIFEAIDDGRLQIDQMLKVSRTAAGRSPSKLGLRRGRSISVRDIIGTLVTKSANDAATVVAEALGGTERKFARLMTRKAQAIGMTRTNFRNASGLPHRRQMSTARDMAILARALLRDYAHYYHFFGLERYSYGGRSYRNHNKLLASYQGLDGFKTGYIRASGYNLVASAERSGQRLIGVIFGGRSPRWRDRHMARLLDRAFGAHDGTARSMRAARARTWPPVPKRKPARFAAAQADVRATDWSIQVGTYPRFAIAHLAITRAARAEPTLLRTPISILRDRDETGRVFHARLTGLTEARARRSCDRLLRRNITCIVLPTEESTGQGSR